MIFHLEIKTCPSLNAQRGQITEVEELNFLNKILVENQSHSDASSFKPSACPATRPHWASLCLSRTRGVQEGEPRASAGQSNLARQNGYLARQTQRSPCVLNPSSLFCPAYPPQAPTLSLCSSHTAPFTSLSRAATGEPDSFPLLIPFPVKSVFFLYYYLSRSHLSFITYLLNETVSGRLPHSPNRY